MPRRAEECASGLRSHELELAFRIAAVVRPEDPPPHVECNRAMLIKLTTIGSKRSQQLRWLLGWHDERLQDLVWSD
eukprot:4823041-Prymnesium_polylepis.1